MRFRLFICFMGTLLLPSAGNAILVSDLPGTSQAMTEATNTMNNWKESISQTAAIQKTVSAVGTAKKGLSTAMNAIKDFQEQVEFYQAQVAEAQAYVQSTVNDVKGAVDTVKNADKIAKGLADRTINSVKNTAMSTVNSVKGTVDSVKNQAVGIGETAKETAGIKDKNTGGSASGTTTGTENETGETDDNNSVADNNGVVGTKAAASDIVDTPSARPSRTAISTESSAVAAVSGGRTISAGGSATVSSGVAAQRTAAVASQAVSVPALASAPASASGTMMQAAVAPQAAKAQVAAQTLNKAEVAQPVAEELSSVQMQKTKETAETLKEAAPEVVRISGVQAETVEKSETLAPVENRPALKTRGGLVQENAAVRQNIREIQKTTLEKAVKADTVKKELKQDIKTVPAQLKTKVQNLKTQKIDNRQLKQIAPQIEKEKSARPARASFKTSSGYGQIKTSTPLAFAQISLKGGTAMGNIMIVPRDIFARCKLDYEQAAEKGKYDECLKKINDIRMSEVSEEVTKDMIDDATEDLYNGYAEMLASGFLEAFEVYNDSVDFYHKQIHPNQEVNAQRIADVSEGWALSKDMNNLLDGRLNALNKLRGRQLLTKGFESYISSGVRTNEDTSDRKAPLNTNMYGKVIISSVLVDRCGVSVTNPEISEDCLKTLATDLKTNAEDTDYGSWQEERGLIVNEYASAYNERAAKALAAVGDNFKNIADLTGMNLSGAANPMEPDMLKKITDNNAIANQAAAKILDALDLRASAIMLDNINRMSTELVPAVNTNDAAL